MGNVSALLLVNFSEDDINLNLKHADLSNFNVFKNLKHADLSNFNVFKSYLFLVAMKWTIYFESSGLFSRDHRGQMAPAGTARPPAGNFRGHYWALRIENQISSLFQFWNQVQRMNHTLHVLKNTEKVALPTCLRKWRGCACHEVEGGDLSDFE